MIYVNDDHRDGMVRKQHKSLKMPSHLPKVLQVVDCLTDTERNHRHLSGSGAAGGGEAYRKTSENGSDLQCHSKDPILGTDATESPKLDS